MTPIAFDKVNGVVKFRYRLSDLKEWIRLGNEGGDVGWILLTWDYPRNLNSYYGYGTTGKNPRRARYKIHFNRWDPFTLGKKDPEPEDMLLEEPEFPLKDFGWIIPDGKGGLKKLEPNDKED